MINVLLIRMAKRRPMCPVPSKLALHETNPEQKVSMCQTMQCVANCIVLHGLREENNVQIVSLSSAQSIMYTALKNYMQYKARQMSFRGKRRPTAAGIATQISLQRPKLSYR